MQLYLEQLAEHIKNIPGKTAIADREGERETSYETLWSLSDRIAAVLIKRGVRKGTFVSILLPREMEYIAASLGILNAGGVIVPCLSAILKSGSTLSTTSAGPAR